MTGLPGQTYEGALAIADYAEHLLDRFGLDGRVHPFVAPLGPFFDPGCRAFEQGDLGYRSFCRTLEDHRLAFLHNSWHKILSYETNAMTRDEIVRATYDVAGRLNDLKYRRGLIDHRTMFGDEELKWPVKQRFRVGATLVRGLAAGLALEFGHTAARLIGRYDVSPARAR